MGLAASQARYLTLSARKNDLEFAAQTISSRRLQLAYKTAEIARQYSDGMNNKVIKVEVGTDYSTGTYVKQWEHINTSNLKRHGLVLFGTNGLPYNYGSSDPDNMPYVHEGVGYQYYEIPVTNEDGTISKTEKKYVSVDKLNTLSATDQENAKLRKVSKQEYSKLDSAIQAVCTEITDHFQVNDDYDWDKAGNDVESLLISGQACLLDEDFANWLMSNFDLDKQQYFTIDSETNEKVYRTFDEMKEQYHNNKGSDARVDIDWRSDITGVMEHKYYTEDDEYVQAKYETETAEIQAQDKMLELEIKNIETQHKAIETELESVQKVIQGNIDKTFKIFS